MRIEDIDPPRETPGAAEKILATLRAHGFEWSGDVLYQSESRFDATWQALLDKDLAFWCACSRKKVLADARFTGAMGPVYPGTCRNAQLVPNNGDHLAIRVRTADTTITFDDYLYGSIQCALATEIGDFIVRRADGLVAYALAVALDDHSQGITEVVRGADLLNFTPAQIFLQQLLDLGTPKYLHVPVAVNQSGVKLSKQTGASPIDDAKPGQNLVRCLEFLQQDPPPSLASGSPAQIWRWARTNWRPRRLAPMVKNAADQAKLFSNK